MQAPPQIDHGSGRVKAVVAAKAEDVISKAALSWALSNVVQPGDNVTLLAVFSNKKQGRRLWNFGRWTGDSRRGGGGDREELVGRVSRISDSCSQMVLQFHDRFEVRVRIKVVLDKPGGAVAAEVSNSGANWVVLDKKLKQEIKHCVEGLSCNVVSVKRAQAKILRLNLTCPRELQTPFYSAASTPFSDNQSSRGGCRMSMRYSTPLSSPESSSPRTRIAEGSLSSRFDVSGSLFNIYEQNPLFEGRKKGDYSPCYGQNEAGYLPSVLQTKGEKVITLRKFTKALLPSEDEKTAFWIPQNHRVTEKPETNHPLPLSKRLLNKFTGQEPKPKPERVTHEQLKRHDRIADANIRDVVSVGRTSSMPPPLCSLCKHKAPYFGKPPRRFSYAELEEATNGFSGTNFIAEGGFGLVHRGILRDGQVVAVKQLKCIGAQADADFTREVRLLSCAQHRNVVLLIGFCIDGCNRVLVYEYICNGSLDLHLHGHKSSSTLDWNSRLKIAIGAARGLRYLHEDCRVGCIVHRDMRPNNILLTHDFEPLVADFGLARWYSEHELGTDLQVIGTSGFLAPEYVNGGRITEKVDVYAFGVVLLELMTGRRGVELQFYKEQIVFAGWLNPYAITEPKEAKAVASFPSLDPRLTNNPSPDFGHQFQAMTHAASLCLQPDPESRPPMSKVLRILEGHPAGPFGLDLNTAGSRSGHLNGVCPRANHARSHSRKLSH
ncbi:hypothetical protein MLD38_034914 [Melastoma candidum]|uniref:Uncharacterized protein n=1 Tax=Melastoma candidum TaxID=119954 RepID=A0ACB9MC06_9MYRT|nr:hypothetical protein MLD38_034914 [Melastoma candidum]